MTSYARQGQISNTGQVNEIKVFQDNTRNLKPYTQPDNGRSIEMWRD